MLRPTRLSCSCSSRRTWRTNIHPSCNAVHSLILSGGNYSHVEELRSTVWESPRPAEHILFGILAMERLPVYSLYEPA
jgi:hypothetical protein